MPRAEPKGGARDAGATGEMLALLSATGSSWRASSMPELRKPLIGSILLSARPRLNVGARRRASQRFL